MNVLRRLALSMMVGAVVGVPVVSQAQSCPAPPGMDVLLFVDNSGSIENDEFDAAQQAIAGIASDVLSRPGNRLAVVNWACDGGDANRDGCRLDLATGSAIAGGWSSNPADFAYAGWNSASNKVCRSFGYSGSFWFTHIDHCANGHFTVPVAGDYAQHALKMLDGALFSGGSTGGSDSYGAATLAPSAPSRRLMIIHMTDAYSTSSSRIREVPTTETALGHYYYSNRLKNMRNALLVGVSVGAEAGWATNQGQIGALSSKGGASSYYDPDHQTAPSTQASDVGTPRLATHSATFNAADILAAAALAFDDAVPACVAIRKQSIGGTGSFSFANGTNGLPNSLTLNTTTTNPATSTGYLTQASADTSIREVVPSGYALSSIGCTNASGGSVPVTTNLSTGLLTIPGSEVVAGAELTCTFTNARSGSITIIKDAVPNSAQDFAFTATGTGLSAFSLDDDADGTLSNIRTFTGLAPGSYSVTETALAGWNLTGLTCVDPDSGSTVNLGTRAATIDLDAGETVTCTYTNTQQGSIVIVKDAVPNSAQDFAFTTTGTGLSAFSLDDDADGTLSNTRTFTGLAPGSYSVTETALAGWNLTGLTCVDPDSGSTVNLGTRAATIDLDAGETVTCTYTNTLRQTDIQVVKTASPNPVVSGDVVTYQIVVTNNGPLAADGAVLTDVAGVGQDCAMPSTTATCSATGGASCPSPTVPVSSLLGSGITIPTLPVGGQVTIGLQCTVSATGTP